MYEVAYPHNSEVAYPYPVAYPHNEVAYPYNNFIKTETAAQVFSCSGLTQT